MVIRSDLLKPDYIDRYGGDTRKLEKPILEHPFLQAEKIDLPPRVIKASTNGISDIEMQKRANYFDLGRDEFMSLEEYLLSGLSNKDLGKAEGGIMSVQGYNGGGMLLKDRLAKIDKNIPSIRLDKDTYFKDIVKAGYVKDDGSPDIKKFNKAAKRVGIDVKDRSASNMQRITNFLNKKSGGSYKNVGMFSEKSALENQASRAKRLIGYYAERWSAFSKGEFWDDAKKLQRKVNKEKISSAEKVKKIARGLKLKWAVPIGTTSFLLTKMGFGKALGIGPYMLDILTPTNIMGFKDVEPEDTEPGYFDKLKREKYGEDADLSYFERIKKQNMRGGGLMDINYMTRPIRGYADGGELPGNLNRAEIDKLPYDREKGSTENLNELMKDIGGTIKEKVKGSGSSLMDKINHFIKYGWGEEEDHEYNKLHKFFWHKGYDHDQINDIINKGVNPEDIVPSRTGDLTEPFIGAKGGIVSLNHLTRRL